MTVLALDLGNVTAGVLAHDSAHPTFILSHVKSDGSPQARVQAVYYCLAEIDTPDLVVWEATWLRPVGGSRINPASLSPMQRQAEEAAYLCGRSGVAYEAIDVQAMNAKTDFRKMTPANMSVCLRMADTLLDGLGEVLCRHLGPRGGMGTAGHLWDAARLARHALTGLRLEGVA